MIFSRWVSRMAVMAAAIWSAYWSKMCIRDSSNNVSQSWVDADNKLQIDPAIQTWMTQAKDFSDNGYTQDCDIWSDECTAQMLSLIHIFLSAGS